MISFGRDLRESLKIMKTLGMIISKSDKTLGGLYMVCLELVPNIVDPNLHLFKFDKKVPCMKYIHVCLLHVVLPRTRMMHRQWNKHP